MKARRTPEPPVPDEVRPELSRPSGMQFFFPDSQDLVDPSFDFQTEQRSVSRVRHQDDLYAHELFATAPYDGILVSKAIVDGIGGFAGKYSDAQRRRLRLWGVREFFRLDDRPVSTRIKTMGDCGAFSYVLQERPPYSVDEVSNFYSDCGFDFGLSIDHVILAYDAKADYALIDIVSPECRERQDITLELASNFLQQHRAHRHRFIPVGVAQGWSPGSYAHAVSELQAMGYRHIALGGMVPLKSDDILDCLKRVSAIREPATKLHLLGVTRTEHVERFKEYGVVSFDSTSPLRRAFKDDKDNYYTMDRAYTAIRVPQVEGNPRLQRAIIAGKVKQSEARRLEQLCLDRLIRYDRDSCPIDAVLDALSQYEQLYAGSVRRTQVYRMVLEDRPWRDCPCDVCRALGIHVILFRGAERNRRRGFHNVFVFYRRLRRDLGWSDLDQKGKSTATPGGAAASAPGHSSKYPAVPR
jgi:hypothetical protein